jgi:hypothetical protein
VIQRYFCHEKGKGGVYLNTGYGEGALNSEFRTILDNSVVVEVQNSKEEVMEVKI